MEIKKNIFQKYSIWIIRLLILLFIVGCNTSEKNQDIQNRIIKKIDHYLLQSSQDSLTNKKRIAVIDSAYKEATLVKSDSLINKVLKQYIKISYKVEDWDVFKERTKEHIGFTKTTDDSLGQAKTLEYLGTYYMNQYIQDSAFYYYERSFKVYSILKDSSRAGRILLNRAIIEKNIRSYSKSIETSFLALKYLKSANNMQWSSSMYNNLGIVYNQLKDKGNALKFHQKAYELRKKIPEKPYLQVQTLNNIGRVYQNNSDYKAAIEYYKQALTFKDVLTRRPIQKARLLDNSAFSRFKIGQTQGVLNQMEEALAIREQRNNSNGIIINCIHLAEYYSSRGDTEKAISYSKQAEKFSKRINNFRDYLESLELLGNLENGSVSKSYFNRNIALRDSLNQVANNYQKNISQMFFEIDDLESKNKKQEKLIERYGLFSAILVVFLIILLWYIRKTIIRKKQQKLKLQEAIQQVLQLRVELFSKKNKKNRLQEANFDTHLKEEFNLTRKQLDFWHLLAEGYTKKEMAKSFRIDERSVVERGERVYKRLEFKTGISKIGYRYAISIYLDEIIEFKNDQIAKAKLSNNTLS